MLSARVDDVTPNEHDAFDRMALAYYSFLRSLEISYPPILLRF